MLGLDATSMEEISSSSSTAILIGVVIGILVLIFGLFLTAVGGVVSLGTVLKAPCTSDDIAVLYTFLAADGILPPLTTMV